MSGKKTHIVLDLDETLLNSVTYSEFTKLSKEKQIKLRNRYTSHNMGKDYVVFERPGLQDFLDYLFKNYRVSIWTAASKSYLIYILDNIILTKKNRRPVYVFFSEHCDYAKKIYGKTKNLKYMKDFLNKDTYILDDNYHVYKSQPKNTIRIYPFYALEDIENEKADHELDKIVISKEINLIKL